MPKSLSILALASLAAWIGLVQCSQPSKTLQWEEPNRSSTDSIAPENPAMKPKIVSIPALQPWLDRRNLSQEQVRELLSPSASQEDPQRAYQKLKPAAWMQNPAQDKAHYYFQEGRLVMIYLSDRSVMTQLSREMLQNALGACPESQVLPCRAGKTAHQYVYPEAGIAFTEYQKEVVFVEMFPPCTLEDYLERIYEPVGPFKL